MVLKNINNKSAIPFNSKFRETKILTLSKSIMTAKNSTISEDSMHKKELKLRIWRVLWSQKLPSDTELQIEPVATPSTLHSKAVATPSILHWVRFWNYKFCKYFNYLLQLQCYYLLSQTNHSTIYCYFLRTQIKWKENKS